MDLHYIIDALLGAIGGLLMLALNSIRERLNEHDAKLDALPETYARRDDVKEGFSTLQATLIRIEERLNRKDG
jgi:hypothetical protein